MLNYLRKENILTVKPNSLNTIANMKQINKLVALGTNCYLKKNKRFYYRKTKTWNINNCEASKLLFCTVLTKIFSCIQKLFQ